MRIRTLIMLAAAFLAGAAAGLTAAPAARQLAKQFLNEKGEEPPGYTHVVASAPGKMIFLSGAGGAGADGKLPSDFLAQARNTFERLHKRLALAGADFKDVVKINYYITDLANTSALREIRARYLDMEHPPASTLVQTGLAPGLLLEVELVAMVPQ
ncbi:MAG TPA: RidA family protein [Bryobacteraceae bacterium]|nr:RidA family protein [Bryobacteraceae bacterium]